ncbi:MAG: response regulator [Chlamydiia bacterium]|nr:response regulator [Chlamydiia bacterium]
MDSNYLVVGSAPLNRHERAEGISPRPRSWSENGSLDGFPGLRILLIDDLEAVHLITSNLCHKKFKWTVISARTAQEGKTLALSEKYDVILLDFNLDKGNKGNEVARKIRDVKAEVLIFSYSNGSVEDETYKERKLWDGHLDKNHIPTALKKLKEELLLHTLH